MSEYIKREGAVEAAWQILNGLGYSEKHNDRLVEEVDAVFYEIPAADVREVKHGKWKEEEMFWGDTAFVCSNCGETWNLEAGTPAENNMNYCPNCGARLCDEESM